MTQKNGSYDVSKMRKAKMKKRYSKGKPNLDDSFRKTMTQRARMRRVKKGVEVKNQKSLKEWI